MSHNALKPGDTVFMLRAVAYLGLQCQLAEQLHSKHGLRTVLVTNRLEDLQTFRRLGHDPSIFADFVYFDDAEMAALSAPVPDEAFLQAEVNRIERMHGLRLLNSIIADRQYGLGFITGARTMRTPFMKTATFRQLVAVAIEMANFMHSAIERHKPVVIIGYPGTLSSALLIELGGAHGIPMRSLSIPRRKNNFFWAASRFGNPEGFSARFSLTLRSLAEAPTLQVAHNIELDEESRPKGATVAIAARHKRGSLSTLLRNIASTCVSNFSFYWFKNPRRPMIYSLEDRLSAQVNGWLTVRRELRKPAILSDLDPSTPYIFFPLCFEPEASLLSDAIDSPSQLTVVDWLARGAPTGWRIIVKEHPAQMLRRPPHFWQTLRRYPNVLIAPQFESGEELMRGARAIAIINGTLGIQGAEHMKPVLCFHHSYVGNVLPQIRITQSFKEVREALADVASGVFSPNEQWHRANLAWAETWRCYEFPITSTEIFDSGRLRSRVNEAEMALMVEHLVRSVRPIVTTAL